MRDGFIFYRSFYEAISDLDDSQQLEIYKAIADFSLNFKEPILSGVTATIFKLIKPQLEANNKRYENGSKPKSKQQNSKTEANNKQNGSKSEAKEKEKEKEKEKDNVKDKYKDIKSDLHPLISELLKNGEILNDKAIGYLEDFISYRKKIKKGIKTSTPLMSYLNTLREINKKGISVDDCILLMKEKEWMTLKEDYLPKIIETKETKNMTFEERRIYNQKVKVEVYPNGNYLDANGDVRNSYGYIE